MGRKPAKINTGDRYGRLVILKEVENTAGNYKRKVLCKCDCGTEKVFFLDSLLRKNTTSCGCKVKENARIHQKNLDKKRIDNILIPALRKNPTKRSQTGVSGVYPVYTKSCIKYRAEIYINKKRIQLGTFDTLQRAKQARLEAEEKYHQPYIDRWKKNRKCNASDCDNIINEMMPHAKYCSNKCKWRNHKRRIKEERISHNLCTKCAAPLPHDYKKKLCQKCLKYHRSYYAKKEKGPGSN